MLILLLYMFFSHFVITGCQDCVANPNLPICKFKTDGSDSSKTCEPFYLIPGMSNECGRKIGSKYLSIDSSTVSVKGQDSDEIKLPGCLTVQFNVEVLQAANLDQSLLAKVNFDWLNLKEFSDLPCKNQSANGCGGYGNNCFYCDICNSLKKLKNDTSAANSNLVKQFTDIDCPNKPGIYLLKKKFCFNDFKDLDKNNNCKLDALESNEGKSYKKALENLQQSGYGTVIAKFVLATNATPAQNLGKDAQRKKIELAAAQELKEKKQDVWAVNKAQLDQFQSWFVQQRIDIYYKNNFLPQLIDENEVACLAVSFTVCDKKPIKSGDQLICPPKNPSIF